MRAQGCGVGPFKYLSRVSLWGHKKKAGKFFFLFFFSLFLVWLWVSLDFPIFIYLRELLCDKLKKKEERRRSKNQSKNHPKKKKKKNRETLCVLACHGGASKRDRERERQRERRRVTRAR